MQANIIALQTLNHCIIHNWSHDISTLLHFDNSWVTFSYNTIIMLIKIAILCCYQEISQHYKLPTTWMVNTCCKHVTHMCACVCVFVFVCVYSKAKNMYSIKLQVYTCSYPYEVFAMKQLLTTISASSFIIQTCRYILIEWLPIHWDTQHIQHL